MKLEFEWHEDKAEVNLETHGVSFASGLFQLGGQRKREQDDYFRQNS